MKSFGELLGVVLQYITIEPQLFLDYFGWAILEGNQLSTNLQLWKICHLEMNHNETVCEDLFKYKDVQFEVQRRLNDFEIYADWISTAPGGIYIFFVGSLADKYAKRKLLLLIPSIGFLLSSFNSLICYIFIRELPLEYFYLNYALWSLAGGMQIYSMGYYSYATLTSDKDNRAIKISIYGAMVDIGLFLGTMLSPIVFNNFGYLTSYALRIGSVTLSILYLIFFVKEPVEKIPTPLEEASAPSVPFSLKSLFMNGLVKPSINTLKCILKKRDNGVRSLLLFQFLLFGLYYSASSFYVVEYIYLLRMFDNSQFDQKGTQFAQLRMMAQVLNLVHELAVLPFLRKALNLHETSILILVSIFDLIGIFCAISSNNFWPEYVIARIILNFDTCRWTSARSLMTKCISPGKEVSSVFAANSILTTVFPLFSQVIFRKIYNATVDTVPWAFMWVSFTLFAMALIGNVYLYNRRNDVEKTAERNQCQVISDPEPM